MRSIPISESVNDNDNSVGEFDSSIFQEKTLMIFLRMRKKSLLKIQLFGSTLVKTFGRLGSLKPLSVICHRIPIIKTNMD